MLCGVQALHQAAVMSGEHQHQGGYEHVPPVSVAQEMHHTGGSHPVPSPSLSFFQPDACEPQSAQMSSSTYLARMSMGAS